MSVRQMAIVWSLRNLRTNERVVLLALADHADDDGNNVFPGVQRLVWKTELAERTVRYTLRRLEARRLVETAVEATPSSPTIYRLTLQHGERKQPFQGGADPAPGGGANRAPGASGRRRGGATGADLSISNHQEKQPSARSSAKADEVTQTPTGFSVPSALLAQWREAFPACDVEREVKAAFAWMSADRRRKKILLGRFLVNWLSRSQDRQGAAASRNGHRSPPGTFEAESPRYVPTAEQTRARLEAMGIDKIGRSMPS